MRNNPVKDRSTALLIILGVVASIYLISIGIGVFMIIGTITPGWVILLFIIIHYRRHRSK